jgi:sialate O-acetylesterase
MMNRILSLSVALAMLCGVAVAGEPALKMPAIFADHMVLQREMKVPVWGWAAPGERITVKIAGQEVSATAGANGKWVLRLEPMKAGGPFVMTVAGKTTVTIKDILVGEVWLCSGQSNMAMTVRGCNNAGAEIKASKDLSQIRHYRTTRSNALVPSATTAGRWQVCSDKTVASFTAAGFFFGRKLHKDLNVPVGLINSSVGGTSINLWTNRLALRPGVEDKAPDLDAPELLGAIAEYNKAVGEWRKAYYVTLKEKKPAPKLPKMPAVLASAYPRMGSLYNGMIYPLIPYGIRGATWYQGENDAGRAFDYRKKLPDMIKGWREVWGQGEFPFLFVQLPNYRHRAALPRDAHWAVMRESQAKALAVPNTGMAVTIDVGDAKNIHPRDKKPVGERLALCALATVYGKDVVYRSPTYDKMVIDGAKVAVHFKHLGGGLVVKGETLKGFAIAGEDKKWAWANAKVDGDAVVLTSNKVAKPVAVRYAWGANPACALFSKAGLPAAPFRTDDWRVATQPKR